MIDDLPNARFRESALIAAAMVKLESDSGNGMVEDPGRCKMPACPRCPRIVEAGKERLIPGVKYSGQREQVEMLWM
jgi:hypothetical protein